MQGIFLMYMYVGSIIVILLIYVWVLFDSCRSIRNGATDLEDPELGAASLTRFGSLKRAHISRSRIAPTNFYIRVGALRKYPEAAHSPQPCSRTINAFSSFAVFGLATLVFNGLEMAMHSMMQGANCLNDIVFFHPVLHGLFTFLQMHFLFVNSQVRKNSQIKKEENLNFRSFFRFWLKNSALLQGSASPISRQRILPCGLVL